MSRQATKDRQAAREVARAEEFIADASKRTRVAKPETMCTAEQIVEQRDVKGLSWKQVATNLGLGSPSGARSAYTRLTGKPHTESNPELKRAHKGATSASGSRRRMNEVQWDDDTDQDVIIEAITHRDIRVVRSMRGLELPEEWVHVSRIERFVFEGEEEYLVVRLFTKESGYCECRVKPGVDPEYGTARAFRVRDIRETM